MAEHRIEWIYSETTDLCDECGTRRFGHYWAFLPRPAGAPPEATVACSWECAARLHGRAVGGTARAEAA